MFQKDMRGLVLPIKKISGAACCPFAFNFCINYNCVVTLPATKALVK